MPTLAPLAAIIDQRTGAAIPARSTISRTEAPTLMLEVFTSIPSCVIVHAATDDRNAPLIREGEIVVVDGNGQTGWYPTDGGLFLIEYVSPPHGRYGRERRSRQIVQTFKGPAHGRWYAGSLCRGVIGNTMYCCDGPYNDENQLAEKLLGPVIGIVATSAFNVDGRA